MSDKTKILLAYIIVLGAILLLGCNPAQKAARIFNEDREAAAKYCAEKFPVKDDTLYLQGGIIIDTLIEVRDSLVRVICPKSDTITEVKQVVKFKTITVDKLRIDTVTVIRENKANTDRLEGEVSKYKAEAQKWKEKSKSNFQFILWLVIILLVIIVLQLFKSKIKLF
jgi:hypothetical protein